MSSVELYLVLRCLCAYTVNKRLPRKLPNVIAPLLKVSLLLMH
jgi:hypothetical protein